ncbi:Transcription-repair coupling factor [hydrothermal vent metagenome]|uniref:Transcription-repair coupling factor n=1 Tax=hydrothermal vent metagenome TaxID=652676 RepID=A0A3B1CWI5_9ZZZZ
MKSLLFASFKDIVKALPQKVEAQSAPVLKVFNLRDSSKALFVALMSLQNRTCNHILITGTEDEAGALRDDVLFYQGILDGSETSDIPVFLPEQGGIESTGIRLKNILKLKRGRLFIGSMDAFLSPTWRPEDLSLSILKLGKGMTISREGLAERLQSIGYRQVPLVSEKGEFSERGWVFDLYPSNMDRPVRLEFFGDELDEIKTFEIDTQRSDSQLNEAEVLPAIEKEGSPLISSFDGETFYYFTETVRGQVSTFDTSPEKCQMLRPAPSFITLHSLPMEGETEASTSTIAGLGLLHSERTDIYGLAEVLKRLEERVVFVLSSESQAKRINEVLRDGGVVAPLVSMDDIGGYSGKYSITVGGLSGGLHISGLIILTEKEIFGRRPLLKPHKASRVKKLLETIEDLKAGDYVVHREHGMGRFAGLEPLHASAYKGEAMVIEYADSARLYLPLQNIGLIQKYRAAEGVIPNLDRLGGSRWKKKKAKARKKVRELAGKLISIYAQREVVEGYSFSPDTELHREFEAFFPFEETADQIRAWEEIKRDMESPRPMDRLLCGDVGYGKTEMAMRAAFKAVYDGKQVAVLVPTTILCEQHFRNFQARFSAFPLKIDFLSRFKSASETKKTLSALSRGDVDIIIGTHGLLSKKVKFYDPGLLIIDEEHRFGVTHKERIKELKKGVDCLSMSATPIPRTLEMSLSGIREMSMIETPPEERLAIKSMITTFNDAVIRKAVLSELDRGGQVFFVHNRVKDIYGMGDHLLRLVPQARLAIAHGQMAGRELEDVMLRFMDGGIDILLATAIIGSGIDIPSANTIIINRADRMGLADLYQLKGRVGRGSQRAYAYFLLPPPDRLTEDARRRIAAIEELSYLGAGLRLAMKDLEIRGAGNLLGADQSGHIHAVGFEMYMEMLQQEVAALKGIPVEEDFEPTIDLGMSAYIPEEYIRDMSIRLSMYRRLSICHSDEEANTLAEEMTDRFGVLPEAVVALIDLLKLKILASGLGIVSVSSTNGTAKVRFSPKTPVKVEDLLSCEKACRGSFHLHEEGFSIKGKWSSKTELVRSLKEVFSVLC